MRHTPLLYLLGAAVAASVFGSSTSDLAKWAVCATSADECAAGAKRDALMMATFLSTVATFLLAALVSFERKTSERETTGLIAGAMVGAAFALFKAAEGEGGYPVVSAVVGPMIIYVGVASVVFGLLIHARIVERISPETTFKLLARFGSALFVGLLSGLLLQFAADLIWRDAAMDGRSSKFIIAAVAPVAGTAAIGSLMIAPTPWGNRGILVLMGFAVTLAASYTWWVYLAKDSNDWIARSSMSPVDVGLRYCLILVAGSLATGAVSLILPRSQGLVGAGVAIVVAAALAASAAFGIGQLRIGPDVFPDQPLRPGTPFAAALVMGLSAALGVALALSSKAIAEAAGRRIRLARD